MNALSSPQKASLVALRLLIGWHFLYEGIIKLYNPSWTAKGYLLSAELLKPFFRFLAGDTLIGVVDTLNIVGLVAVGIALLAGLRVKWGCIAGMVLLLFYYLAHPPFGPIQSGPAEGSYWIVNKNLIEIAALFLIYVFPVPALFSIENLFRREKSVAQQ